MAVTWDVTNLDVTKTVGSLSDVITTVHWTASDADGEHTGYVYGSVRIADPDSSSFTEYKSVTKENAVAWAKAVLGADKVTRLEKIVADQIAKTKTPTESSGVPW